MRLIVAMFFLLICNITHIAYAGGMSSTDAFNMGKDLGNAGKDNNFSGINNTNASANVPGYASSSNESQYFESGMGNITAPASTQVQSCLNTTNDADRQSYGKCESVRMINQSKGKARSMFALDPTKDPLIKQGKNIQKTPSDYTGTSTTGGSYSGCVDKIVKDPDVTEIETCQDYKTIGESTCTKKNNVTVTENSSCTPGTYFVSNNCRMQLRAAWQNNTPSVQCNRNASNIPIQHQLVNYGFATAGTVSTNFVVNENIEVINTSTVKIGRTWTSTPAQWTDIYRLPNSGCTGNDCSMNYQYHFYYGPSFQFYCNVTLRFTKPHISYTVTDNWDNQCAALEARAQ